MVQQGETPFHNVIHFKQPRVLKNKRTPLKGFFVTADADRKSDVCSNTRCSMEKAITF